MKTKTILALLILCSAVILLVALLVQPSSHAQSQTGQVVGSRQGATRQVTVRVHPPMRSALRKTPPDLPPPREPEDGDEEFRMDPPVDPSVRPADIRPTSPETVAKITPGSPSDATTPKLNAPQAAGTFTVYRNTPLASAPCLGGVGTSCMGGVTLNSYVPIEPSAAVNGRIVFYTTNNYAAFSGDGGQTFSYLNPFDNFPADGTNDPVNGGFGGDQYVYYERTRGLMFWLLQYNADSNTNRQRIAFALNQADVLNNNWSFLDLTPATYGFTTPPAGASGFWMDFPDLAVSDNFLYLTTNVFQRVLPSPSNGCKQCGQNSCPTACNDSMGKPTCTQTCSSVFVGAVAARLPLNQFAQGQVNVTYYTDTKQGYRLTQGAHATMYWGAHNSNTQLRIYSWPENGNVSLYDVNHAAYNIATMTATSPDGTDFAASADSRIQGAWVANSVIGFMWGAAQGGGFPYPQVQVLRFNQSDGHLLSQGQVWSSNYAYLYPSVHPNDRGDLGGTMAWGGGTNFPQALAWIADDFNNGTITPLENVTFASGNAGPCDPKFDPIPGNTTPDCYNRWGDYFATRVHSPYGNTWLGTGFVLNGANGATHDPRYVWFGRERDTPPATNTIFVSLFNTSGYEDGSIIHPYNTVAKGNFASLPGDVISIVPGNYNEPVRLNRASRLERFGPTGTVTVGRP